MTSSRLLFILVLFIFLGLDPAPAISQAIDPSTPGVYLLAEVNGKSLPSVSSTKKSEDRHCENEALDGAMLLDSEGRWAALVTERETCTDRDGSRTVTGEASSIFVGTYEGLGNHIIFHDETLGGDDEGTLEDGVLVITVVGGLDDKSQTTEWVLRKVVQ